MGELERARNLYETEYQVDLENRNYRWHPRNPMSLIHWLIMQYKLTQEINHLDISLAEKRILDVGCGYGRILRLWGELGGTPAFISGLDLTVNRLERAENLAPGIGWVGGSAGALPYSSGVFDMVSQFVVFSSIHDENLRRIAADEMMRVLKKGGWLIWYDLVSGEGGNTIPIVEKDVLGLFKGLSLVGRRPIYKKILTRMIQQFPLMGLFAEFFPIGSSNGLLLFFRK